MPEQQKVIEDLSEGWGCRKTKELPILRSRETTEYWQCDMCLGPTKKGCKGPVRYVRQD